MIRRIYYRFKFFLEKQMVRGALFQLLFMVMLILFITIVGGYAAFVLTLKTGSFGEASWWAFLRMTDPGYLGDDEGTILRIISTIVTICGYVFFMGSLIAIMTTWLNSTMKKLESGLTPITLSDHMLIIGWTNRTVPIIQEILLSQGRVRRFLNRIGACKLNIVILAEEANREILQELREQLGELYDRQRITLRSGNPLRVEHLQHAQVGVAVGDDTHPIQFRVWRIFVVGLQDG